jgi:hypothetical protein
VPAELQLRFNIKISAALSCKGSFRFGKQRHLICWCCCCRGPGRQRSGHPSGQAGPLCGRWVWVCG